VLKFRHHGVAVEIAGMNEATGAMVERLAKYDKPGAALASGH
jgi:SulP family sulfate permease